ncbi:hypothetical protein JYT72_02060 [Crocinitomix catalasitica]|nr:hypothetical protein [Crocinitomix catalasitica]
MRKFILILFLLTPLVIFSQTYKVGQQIEVQIEDVWFEAYVIEIDGKNYRLNYSRMSDDTDFWVKEEKIRKKTFRDDNKGNGNGSVTFEHNTGSKPHDIKKDKKKKSKDKYIATTTKIITLHNTCDQRETFVIQDIQYEIDGYQKIDLEVEVGTSIFSLENNQKVIRGRVTNSITVFRPSCN